MNQTVEAIYEDGVLKPLEELDIPEHERVSITIDTAKKLAPEEIIQLAQRVFSGFTSGEIAEIEEMILNRSRFFREN